MKKIILILISIVLFIASYKIFMFLIEGTQWDSPKIFYEEEKHAIYTITVDKTAGYYFLEGTNGYPDHTPFRILIVDSPVNLEDYINKKVYITAYTKHANSKEIPCRKDWKERCLSPPNRDMTKVFGIVIQSIKLLNE